MQTVSAVIPVYNVEPIIAECLDALRWADEVALVDMLSTDRTEEICRSYANVRYHQNRDCIFANFNYGLERASGDRILLLDSDEVVTPDLAAEIRDRVLAHGEQAPYNGFEIPCRVYFFGKWLRHGPAWTDPPRKDGLARLSPKLFRRGSAYHACRSEHERITDTGPVGRLEHPFDHYSHPTVSGWIAKMNYHTDRDVERIDVLAPDYRLPGAGRTLVALVKVFYEMYIRRRGYRDGIHGFMACALNTLYILVMRCKVWEKHWRLTRPDEVVPY